MAKRHPWQWIPTKLSVEQFDQFVLRHLITGIRRPAPKLLLHSIFNYILRLLFTGCQWNELPIEKDARGQPEIHYTRVYRMFRFWHARGCIDAIFADSVFLLDRHDLLDISVVHGDGSTTAAKKGGDHMCFPSRFYCLTRPLIW
jgi:transposase